MKKLGVSGNPIILRVANEERMGEVAGICQENNWKFICGIEPDEPEDISDLEFMLYFTRHKFQQNNYQNIEISRSINFPNLLCTLN